MASLGTRYEYPEYTFSACVAWIEQVGREKIKTFDTFTSSVLGHKNPKSGGVNVKMGALNKYFGLLEKNGKEVNLTPLGERIVFPMSSRARTDACREAVSRVTLLKDLYAKLKMEFHEQDFRPVLQDLSGAKPPEVLEKAEEVERLYRDAARYLQGVPEGESAIDRTTSSPTLTPTSTAGGSSSTVVPPLSTPLDATEYHVYQTGSGDTFVRVKRDEKVLKMIRGLIDVWIAQEADGTVAPGAPGGS